MNYKHPSNPLPRKEDVPTQTLADMASMHFRIFSLYLDMADREKAILYGVKALAYYKDIDDKETLQYLYERLAELHDFFGESEKALAYYSECRQLENG